MKKDRESTEFKKAALFMIIFWVILALFIIFVFPSSEKSGVRNEYQEDPYRFSY